MSTAINVGEHTVTNFPEPITLVSSRKKWSRIAMSAVTFSFLGILASFRGGTLVILSTVVFIAFTVIGLIMLLPGSSSLRLHKDGFDVTKFFRKKRFRWTEVSDIGVVLFRASPFKTMHFVVFKTVKPRLNSIEKMNAALAGGRNECLPDTYGLTARIWYN